MLNYHGIKRKSRSRPASRISGSQQSGTINQPQGTNQICLELPNSARIKGEVHGARCCAKARNQVTDTFHYKFTNCIGRRNFSSNSSNQYSRSNYHALQHPTLLGKLQLGTAPSYHLHTIFNASEASIKMFSFAKIIGLPAVAATFISMALGSKSSACAAFTCLQY
jgi:hypothetical protein